MNFELYEIRLLRKEELPKLKRFINDYWRANHIISRDDTMFEFQHSKAEDGFYDFVIAYHKQTQEIHAVLGFINSSLYDESEKNNPNSIAGAIWKVRDDIHNKEIGKVGLELLYYLLRKYPNSPYITLGLSQDSQFIYRILKFHFSKMNHYYIANPKKNNFKICCNPFIERNVSLSEVLIKELDKVPPIENHYYPNKDSSYVVNRYLNHPYYKYKVWGIMVENRLVSIWVTRKVDINGASCLRLVDMVGEIPDQSVLFETNQMLVKEDAEYIDCYNYGLSEDSFLRLGFQKVKEDTIVPNYFEPFLKENIDIYCAYYYKSPVIMFKGDADQDRPN